MGPSEINSGYESDLERESKSKKHKEGKYGHKNARGNIGNKRTEVDGREL
jgi:hypothetical protein